MAENEECKWQQQITWFEENRPDKAPSAADRRSWVDPSHKDNPFHNFIGNEHAVRELGRMAFTALGRFNRCCNDQAIALLGPSSTGKTTLAGMFAELVAIPFVEISPQSVSNLCDVAFHIAKVCEETVVVNEDDEEVTLELTEVKAGYFVAPPMIVFIDEVHNLSKKVEQGLLKAIATKDAILSTENQMNINTQNICWIIATTDRGCLFDAFDTRFTKIHLNNYTMEEVAKIVQVHNKEWSIDTCKLASKFGGHIPREALQFANSMKNEYEMRDGLISWETAAMAIAKDKGIDAWGMDSKQVKVLKALGHGPVSKNRLCAIVGCKEAEMEKFVMPRLLAAPADQQPLVSVTSKGYVITKEGLAELDKRSIAYSPDLFVRRTALSKRLNRNTDN